MAARFQGIEPGKAGASPVRVDAKRCAYARRRGPGSLFGRGFESLRLHARTQRAACQAARRVFRRAATWGPDIRTTGVPRRCACPASPDLRQGWNTSFTRRIPFGGQISMMLAVGRRRAPRATGETVDGGLRAPPRSLNVAPRAPAHWSGPLGAWSGPKSVRSHGATPRGGADRTTRDAGRRAKDPTRTARGMMARRAEPRHTSTTPIEVPILDRHPPSVRRQ